MTSAGDVFLRIGDHGWLVIADQLPPLGGEFAMLSERIVNNTDISYTPFLIHAEGEAEQRNIPFVEDVAALLGTPFEIRPLHEARQADVAQPGLLVLTGGSASDWIRGLDTSPLGGALKVALDEGAVIIASDAAAAALGSWTLERGSDRVAEGLEWLPGAVVLPWLADPAESEQVRKVLARSEPLYALGIADGRFFAFGPHGKAELWGVAPPTLALGVGWR